MCVVTQPANPQCNSWLALAQYGRFLPPLSAAISAGHVAEDRPPVRIDLSCLIPLEVLGAHAPSTRYALQVF
jgi:hypothetical protein